MTFKGRITHLCCALALVIAPQLSMAETALVAVATNFSEVIDVLKADFEVAVAEPAMMKNLSQIAKILGTRGLMPSPKNETVTPDPAKAVA